MSRQILIICLSIVFTICSLSQGHAAGVAATLKTNPFSNPYLSEMNASKAHSRDDFSTVALELRGTMVAGGNSQANIGGVIIAVGEDVEGYKLVAIKQRSVILDKNGVTKTLSLDPDERESGNE